MRVDVVNAAAVVDVAAWAGLDRQRVDRRERRGALKRIGTFVERRALGVLDCTRDEAALDVAHGAERARDDPVELPQDVARGEAVGLRWR